MDKYDEAIAYLTQHPEEIYDAWNERYLHLFDRCGLRSTCGCLTQVKYEHKQAQTPALTAAIRADDRIPEAEKITVDDLPVFAEWQRRLDKELGRG
jgi:hypothetical protein